MRGLFLSVALAAVAVSAQPKRTLAVTYFDINGGNDDYKPLGKGMADMLITDLLVLKSLTLVERAKLNLAIDELKLSKSPFIDKATAVKLGKGLAATHMLTGAITVLGTKMRIDARVLDVQSGEVVQGKQVDGESQEFFALEKELVDLLVEALEIKPDLKEKAALRKSQTESFDAIKGYSQGLDALDKGDKPGAQAAFATAAKVDPAWPALKVALESLTRELDAADAKGAQSLDQKLQALRAEDPELFKKVEKLSKPDGVPYGQHYLAGFQVQTALMKKGLKPSKERYAGYKIGASKVEHWEARELKDLVGSFGDEPQALAGAPVLLEYLVRKYSDDPTFLEEVSTELRRLKTLIGKADFSKPPPEITGSGENVDRRKAHTAWLNAHAKAVPLPAGLPRDPVKSLARLEELLAKEAARRHAEFLAEIKKRMAALSTTDVKLLTQQLHELTNNISAHDSTDRVEGTKLDVAVTRWLIDHPDLRPYNGTPADPSYLELSRLQQLFVRYDNDPDSWELIPPAGQYLLKKFAGAPYLTSQLRLTLDAIESSRKDGLERAKKRWAEEVRTDREREAAPEVREAFKRAGEQGRTWKAK